MTGGWKRWERENGGRNLGRPAPRAARKLGQVFCTCRSNAGTFMAALIVVIVTFRFPIFHPLSFPTVVFVFALVQFGNHCKRDGGNCFTQKGILQTVKGKNLLHLERDCFEIFLILKCNKVNKKT